MVNQPRGSRRGCPTCEAPSKPGLIFCEEHGCEVEGCRYPKGHIERARKPDPSIPNDQGSPGAVHRGMPFVV